MLAPRRVRHLHAIDFASSRPPFLERRITSMPSQPDLSAALRRGSFRKPKLNVRPRGRRQDESRNDEKIRHFNSRVDCLNVVADRNTRTTARAQILRALGRLPDSGRKAYKCGPARRLRESLILRYWILATRRTGFSDHNRGRGSRETDFSADPGVTR